MSPSDPSDPADPSDPSDPQVVEATIDGDQLLLFCTVCGKQWAVPIVEIVQTPAELRKYRYRVQSKIKQYCLDHVGSCPGPPPANSDEGTSGTSAEEAAQPRLYRRREHVVMFIVALVFVAIGLWLTMEEVWLSAFGQRTLATVERFEEHWGRRRFAEHSAEVSFETDSGIHRGTIKTGSTVFAVGERVPVLYLPNDPARVGLDDGSRYRTGAFFLVVGLVSAFLFFPKKRRWLPLGRVP